MDPFVCMLVYYVFEFNVFFCVTLLHVKFPEIYQIKMNCEWHSEYIDDKIKFVQFSVAPTGQFMTQWKVFKPDLTFPKMRVVNFRFHLIFIPAKLLPLR